jgi:hypothetical protein
MIIDPTLAEKNVSIATEYYKLLFGVGATDNNRKYVGGGTGFIPFKLSFTLDGISGCKIYQKLRINTSFLPMGYAETIDFVITGISHKLNDHDWETNIQCIMIPKFEEYTSIITSGNFTYVPPRVTPIVSPSVTTTNKADNNSTWADKVRQAAETLFPNKTGGNDSKCAGWTSRLAQVLTNIVLNKPSPGNKYNDYSGWGDAYDVGFKNQALNTGIYEVIYEDSNLSKQEIITKINGEIQPKAEYGDIVQYYLTNRNNSGQIINSTINQSVDVSGGYVFHTQIFTGNWATGVIDGKGKQSIGWTSSWPSNYGASFVYESRTLRTGNDKYTLYWLRVKDEYRK